MDEKICIGCKYSDAYSSFSELKKNKWIPILACRVLNPHAPTPCKHIFACPFVPSNGKDPGYIDLMRTIRVFLINHLDLARGLWDEMTLSDNDQDGKYTLGKEIVKLETYERDLTVRLIRAMRREEEKKNHE
ncbi:hypothetical protein [Acidaminococcus sp. HCP3S3_G9_1]|uniref:hypothetical protein n=1 Tax=Acidaminococcus sp. HCP3S3_G9_1 TaxID=3438732 RepID=UPI003F93B60D